MHVPLGVYKYVRPYVSMYIYISVNGDGHISSITVFTADGRTCPVALFGSWSHCLWRLLILKARACLASYLRISTMLSSWNYEGRSGRCFLL
jgi:hypothetical protein